MILVEKTPQSPSRPWAVMGYMLVVALALTFDVLTDKSLGALMLSVIPISIIAAFCLISGPWLRPERMASALRSWMIGAALVLCVALLFSSLGPEQAKTGELILTYALLAMAIPSSVVLPFAVTITSSWLAEHTMLRIIFMWMIVTAAGWVQWQALCWLRGKIQRKP